MYKIIGQDGKEYGPINAAQLRQWIVENRVESRTPVFADGAKDWTFVGLLPEFAGLFPTAAPQVPPPIHGTSTAGQIGRTNSFAITGFVCGILSVSFCWCCGGFPFNVLGLVFSIVALMQINENPQLHGGRGLAITGIILTSASFLIFLVLLASGHAHVNINNGQFCPEIMPAASQAVPPKIRSAAPPSLAVFAAVVLGMAIVGAGAVIFFFNPAKSGFYPECQFHKVTGLNCPGCGATRALYELLHGNLPLALKDNALFILSLAGLASRGAWFAAIHFLRKPAGSFLPPAILWGFLAIALIFTVARNLPGFEWLSP